MGDTLAFRRSTAATHCRREVADARAAKATHGRTKLRCGKRRFETPERNRFARISTHELRELCPCRGLRRRALGLIGRDLLKHGPLSTARVRPHSRLCHGTSRHSGRTLETAALVAARLDALPCIGAAFERGELSGRTSASSVPLRPRKTTQAWLRHARGRRTNELAALVASTHGTRDPDPRIAAGDDLIEGEEALRVRIACPSRLRVLWRYALDLAGRMAGSRLPTGVRSSSSPPRASAGRPPGAIVAHRLMRAWMRAWRAHSHERSDDDPPSDASTELQRQTAVSTKRRTRSCEAADDNAPVPAPCVWARPSATTRLPSTHGCVRRSRSSAAPKPRLGAFCARSSTCAATVHSVFRSTNAYVRDRLGISVRKAWR